MRCQGKVWSHYVVETKLARVKIASQVYRVILERTTDPQEMTLSWAARWDQLGRARPVGSVPEALLAVSSDLAMKILIAGANGHLGRRFIERFGAEYDLIALVRSPAAAEVLFQLPCQVAIVAYGDTQQMSRLAEGAEVLINLTGIIKATKSNPYQKAHEETAAALVAACQRAGVPRILTLGICGSDLGSKNACFSVAREGRIDSAGRGARQYGASRPNGVGRR
jgi:hypothetical protein